MIARIEQLERDLPIHTGLYLFERERHGDLGVRTRARTSALLAAAKHVSDSAERAEIAHEDVERLRQIHMVKAGAATAAAQPRLAVAIVGRALLRILEDVVRLGDLLEFLLGILRPVVAIGVPPHRELAVCLGYIGVGRFASHLENRVKISH